MVTRPSTPTSTPPSSPDQAVPPQRHTPHRLPPPDLRAAEVMSSPVVTVGPDESLWTAWDVLSRSGFRHLVVAEGDRCVGVLDDRRIMLAWPHGPVGPQRRTVRHIMPTRVHCVLGETPISRVAEIMLSENVDAVPVVAEDGAVLGLLTSTDLLAVVAGCLP